MKKPKNKKSIEKDNSNSSKTARSGGTQKPAKMSSGNGPRRPTGKSYA